MWFEALSRGDLDGLKSTVTDLNASHSGFGLLHTACGEGYEHIVEWLLAQGAAVNARDALGVAPLDYCATYDHPACMKRLLDAGADASARDRWQCIALHRTSTSRECASLLVAAFPEGVFAVNAEGDTPLHMVAANGGLDVCRVLLEAGSMVDAVNAHGKTALYFAFQTNRRLLGELLLDYGAKLERVALDGGMFTSSIPDWAVSFVARRNAHRASCWAVLELARRRSRVVRGNGRDALKLVARIVWQSRQRKEECCLALWRE